MHLRPRRAMLVAACAALLAPLCLSMPAGASAPPATDAQATIPDGPVENGEEVIHSWALTPGGNADPDAAGNRSQLTYSADPGTVIEDSVTLYNYSNQQLLFRVYATDAFNTDDGNFDLLPGKDAPVDVGSWVVVAQENITVEPGRQVTIPITITVPPEATPGDHVGAVVASSPTPGVGGNGEQVLLDRRTGTRLYLRVNGPLTPNLAVTAVDTSYDHAANPLAGSATVQFRVENRGNVRVAGVGTVEIAGPFGIGAVSVETPEIPELLPGSAMTMVVDVVDVPALFLATTTVRVSPAGDASDAPVSEASDRTFAPPLGVLLVVLALVLGTMVVRRARRHGASGSSAPDAGVLDADALDREPQHS